MRQVRDKKTFNPFPGLRPFAPEESDLFFGRKGESEEVLGKLLKNRFVTVMGASGTGKSSLIYCGVLPGVKELRSENSGGWRIITFRPGNDPFGNFTKSLTEVGLTIPEGYGNHPEGVTGMIRDFLAGSNDKVLLVIDQFEELFRYGSLGNKDASLSTQFIDSLVKAAEQREVNVFTIITMRSDFIGECAHYQGLTQLINNSNYLVPHMGRENYREAIEGPVKYAGATIDPVLVNLLLDHIGQRTDQLPVLQHAMMRTWTYWQELDEPDRPLGKSDYEAVGTMSDAMSLHANEAYEELSARGKEICESMFKTITDKGSDNKGLRRPSGVKTITSIADCTSEELFEVVEKFRITSRSFLTPRENIPLNEDSIIDISHESLMRLWDRLREWVNDEAASVQMYMRLSEASALFQQGKTNLWRPPDLQLAINWREKHKPTLTWAQRYNPAFERAMVYLRTSEQTFQEEEDNKIKLQKRQIRRRNIVTAVLGVATLISMGFMLFAFVQKIAADRQTQIAKQAQQAEAVASADAQKSAKEALAQKVEADTQKVRAQKSATLAELRKLDALNQQKRAETEAERARQQEQKAKEEEARATQQSIVADTNRIRAEKQKIKAERLRKVSIGKAMAIKSLQATGQKDLQALLAYQAYLFNKSNGGIENDADIYAGLYNISRQTGSSNCRSFKGHTDEINSIAYVPGKNEFYTAGADGLILKWSLDSKENSIQVVYNGKNEKTGITEITDVLAVSPDASWLAAGTKSTIRIIPLKSQEGGYVLTAHKGNIKSLIYSFDGKYLYSAALDGKVLKWDLAARTSTDITDGSVKITSIDISSNGNFIAGISSDGKVMVLDPERKSSNFSLSTSGKNIRAIRFNPQNNLLAVGDLTGLVELWDVKANKKISEVRAHDAEVNDIRFNTLLNQMATAGKDKKMKIFNITDPSNLTQPPITFTDESFVMAMQFSPDGQLIVSGAYRGPDNLVCRPSHVDYFVKEICNLVSRNMTQSEWNTYVGNDIDLEPTCSEKSYNIKVSAIK
jgi:WD40 repeat protein